MTSAKGEADDKGRPAKPNRPPWNANQTLLAIIGGSCVASGIFNILHANYHYSLGDTHLHPQQNQQHHHKQQHEHEDFHGNAIHRAMHDFMKGTVPKKKTRAAVEKDDDSSPNHNNEQDDEDPEGAAAYRQHDVDNSEEKVSSKLRAPSLAKLSCEKYGGPADEFAQEMVYWNDIRSDTLFVSPFHPSKVQRGDTAKRLYMTFEPDEGGWNNIRMALETVLGLAIAMGRTLVLPPAKRLYLLGKAKDDQKTHFGFADFFPMHELAAENQGLEIITMKEFLELEAMTGHLRNR